MAEADESAVLEVSSLEKSSSGLSHQESKDNDVVSNNSYSFDASVVASPSVGSFSTFPDNDESEFPLDTRDLQVRVDNPQKHLDTLETYITFRITTKTSRAEFDETEYIVRRRYNDFTWLREKLVATFPTHLIPPLPGKHSLIAQLDRYSKEFVAARMALLHRFLNRIANHPILSFYPVFKMFLTAKPSEFSIARRATQGLLRRVAGTLSGASLALATPPPCPEFDRASRYAAALGEKLSALERAIHRSNKHYQELHEATSQLPPALTLWSASEPHLSPILLAVAAAATSSTEARRPLMEVTTLPLVEYRLYTAAVGEAVARRSAVQARHEATVEQLANKKKEKMQLLKDESPSTSVLSWRESKEVRLAKVDQAIPTLSSLVEATEDEVQCANENLRADLERWHAEKCADLKDILISWAELHVQCCEDSLDAWENVIPSLQPDQA